jgi:2-polyprenyl-3-methyl-5-hydroxy-6-metoxy-1,4-benzoquinol methylase
MKPIEALNRLTEIATSFCVSQMFATACTIGVFDQLSHGPVTAEELAGRLNINADACRRLLVALTHVGLLERGQDHYRNSELGSFLTSHSQTPLEPLSMWANPFYRMWEYLSDALREYGPRWQQATGSTAEETFAALYEDPVRLRRFCGIMNAYSIPIGQEVAARFDFTPFRCLMDVAGGAGEFSQQIGLKYPHLRGIVMDLPPVCKVAEEHIAANGLTGRFTAVTADLFAGPYPAGADVITLSWVLHDWSDESCRKILRNCFDALPSGGVLLVSESVLRNDFSGKAFTVLLSLHMLVVCEPGAKERTESEYRSLLEDAGFRDMQVIRLEGPRDLIVARKS